MSNKKNILFLREEYGDGQGTFTYPNGEKYVGDWKNGKYHGHGTFTYPDGNMYVGEFKDDDMEGKGTYTWGKGNYEGQIYLGVWKEEEPWNGTSYDKDGKILSKYVNGKWIKT